LGKKREKLSALAPISSASSEYKTSSHKYKLILCPARRIIVKNPMITEIIRLDTKLRRFVQRMEENGISKQI
jgi:hypothetical protein